MHWRFDPLFSIAVCHGKYKDADPDTGQLPRNAPDFVLEPTYSTVQKFAKIGWIVKPETGGCKVYGEKTIAPDGTSALRALPATNDGLTFQLRLINPLLLNETHPYVLEPTPELNPNPNPDLPAFSGFARTLYFDNRHPTARPGGELRLTPDRVEITALGSRARTPFTFKRTISSAQNVAVIALAPGSASQTFIIPDQADSVPIDLPENGYQITQQGGGPETIFLSQDALQADTLGIIRIFEPTDGSGWESRHRYQIFFDQI